MCDEVIITDTLLTHNINVPICHALTRTLRAACAACRHSRFDVALRVNQDQQVDVNPREKHLIWSRRLFFALISAPSPPSLLQSIRSVTLSTLCCSKVEACSKHCRLCGARRCGATLSTRLSPCLVFSLPGKPMMGRVRGPSARLCVREKERRRCTSTMKRQVLVQHSEIVHASKQNRSDHLAITRMREILDFEFWLSLSLYTI